MASRKTPEGTPLPPEGAPLPPEGSASPMTATKAYVATGLTVLVSFLLYWVGDEDPFTPKEAAAGLVAALAAGGLVGVPTYKVRNRAK